MSEITRTNIRAAMAKLALQPRDEPLLYFATPSEWDYFRAEALRTGEPFECFGAQGIVKTLPIDS